MPSADLSRPSARVAFSHPAFVRFQSARFFTVLATEMQAVAVGWQVYEITKRPLDLGLVGLAQFLPGMLLFLLSGYAADHLNRRKLLIWCDVGFAVCFTLLLGITLRENVSIFAIYVVLVLLGVVRSFNAPVSRAMLPYLVPPEHFENSVAWSSTVWQAASILGPVAGGLLYAAAERLLDTGGGPGTVYACALAAALMATVLNIRVPDQGHPCTGRSAGLAHVFEGFRYIWREKLILGAISLDLFAVLLGGAVALLPVYAREILRTGPWGLGLLRTAPGVGAAMMAVLLAHRPLRGRSGYALLWAVAGFGIFTIIFGLSRSLTVSLIALLLLGASDMISVIIRATLTQLATPDEMRGRVTAVDMIFIGTSNEFGQFESGVTAQWFGTERAVVLGGIGTLIVIVLWAWLFPDLRNADQLHNVEEVREA